MMAERGETGSSLAGVGTLPARFRQAALRELARTRARILILVALNVAFALSVSAVTPYFLTLANFKTIFIGNGMEFVLAGFMTYLLVARMFDLSIDGVVNMAGVITGLLLGHNFGIAGAIALGLLSGVAVGALNGIAVTKLRMNPLMTTLATWWGAQGIAYGLTIGISPHLFPESFDKIGAATPAGLDMPVWYMIGLLPVLAWVLATTRFGYHVYATGGDPEAARLRGVRVDRVIIVAFVLMGLAAAFTGIVFAGRLDAASPVAVNGLNLRVIAGAVIGGCSLSGGRGTVFGAALGMLFMAMLNNATIILGVNPYWQYTILGAVVFAAVAADALVARSETTT
jgi:ribose transport system permease protein